MSVWHLFSTMGMLGGDLLSLFSIIGSAVVLFDSLLYNSPLHRLGKFLDMSGVCLVMGTIGQFAIAYASPQVERVGFLQIRIIIVNRFLALSFLFLLVSWLVRRSHLQLMRFWRNFYPLPPLALLGSVHLPDLLSKSRVVQVTQIWRGAKQIDQLVSGTMYMDKDIVSMANQFGVYSKLGWWYDSWQFRRHLSWLGEDRVSLDYLLEFEEALKKKSFSTFKIVEILEEILRRCHKEELDNHHPNRIPHERLPDMLQVMLVFYSKSGRLHRSCRELIISILQAEEEIKAHHATGSGIPAEQFRVEAVKAISSLSTDWGKGNEAYLKGGAAYLLHYLTSVARNVSDLQMFTQFQHEAQKIIDRYGLWLLGERLHPLATISSKVGDQKTFRVIFQDIVPVHGMETTSYLLGICKDFQEFELYYPRMQQQLRWWGSDFAVLFIRAKNTSGLDWLLGYLETLAKQERITKYIHYTEVHNSGSLLSSISGALHTYKGQIFNKCSKHDWTRETEYDRLIDEMVDAFETTILDTYLNTIWNSLFQARKIRWEFSKFTDSIPYGIISWEWTQDNDKTRSYWNWTDAAAREHDQYIKTLGPLLLPLFRKLEFSEIEALFDLLPQYLGIEEFKTKVKVPVEWEKDTEYHEAYDKWAGHYTQVVEVARPTSFVDHTFTFERPYLKNAIDLLIMRDRVHEAIQAYRKSRTKSDS